MCKITLCTCKLPYYSPGSHLRFPDRRKSDAGVYLILLRKILKTTKLAKRINITAISIFCENFRIENSYQFLCLYYLYSMYVYYIYLFYYHGIIIINDHFSINFFGRQFISQLEYFLKYENSMIIFYRQVILPLNV